LSDFIKGLQQQIETLWAETGAYPDLVEVMRLALVPQSTSTAGTVGYLSRLARLPGLCCQAAGGEFHWADKLTVAWLLFYAAADLMDSIQDQEIHTSWREMGGVSAALNAATGLYFSASWALNDLYNHQSSQDAAHDVVKDFYQNLLLMSWGQQREITNPEPTLEQYWHNAEAKSGAFFSLACKGGARLGSSDLERVDKFARIGNHLGLVIQLLDDLDEVRSPEGDGVPGQKLGLARSLPAVYALDVSSTAKRALLRKYLVDAPHNPTAADEALKFIDASGASVYILAEIERHRALALEFLTIADPNQPAGDELSQLIHDL
jgi:geranylgeranyl pyrophosphate synthase